MALYVGLTVEKYKGIEPSAILSLIKKFGLNFVEITKSVFEELHQVLPLMSGMRAGFHLPLVCEDGYDLSCLDYDSEIKRLIELINKNWQALNISYCIAHPPEPSVSKVPLRTSVSYLLQNLNKLEPPILLENVPSWDESAFSELFERGKTVLGHKLAGLCFDAPHYFVRGQDPLLPLSSLNGQIKCIHLSDCVEGKDLHLPFGAGGQLPLDQILDALKTHRYDGYINLELMPRTLNDLEQVVYSYLKVLKAFDRVKYYRTKLKVILFFPIIRHFLP